MLLSRVRLARVAFGRRRAGRSAVGLALLLAGVVALAGCGSSEATEAQAIAALGTGMPVRGQTQPLANGLVTSSPDGGFYTDPTYLHFQYLRRVPLGDLIPLLSGSEAQDARSLEGLGSALEVVVTATNPGASTTAVDLTQTVLESRITARLDPSGLATSIQKTYYNPIRPIAVLSSNRLDVCSADVNPGAMVWMIAVFPPVNRGVRVALVDSEFVKPTIHGFYLPIGAGALPHRVPRTLYAQDVDHCIQILNES
ncbi:MAG: hypothetical protein ACREOL_10640 [Candidatus Dormibacteria bacterium]